MIAPIRVANCQKVVVAATPPKVEKTNVVNEFITTSLTHCACIL